MATTRRTRSSKSRAEESSPSAKSNKPNITAGQIFLYVPNLIGYTRVILAGASLRYMPWHPKYCTALYSVSCLLDALDGFAARRLNQATRFGAILDMVTDRCTTSCLICFLAVAYPRYMILFQFLLSLDLASHYMHMVAMMQLGSNSHKKVSQVKSKILNLYYSNTTVLFIFCFANELFFVVLYLASFFDAAHIPLYVSVIGALTLPIWLGKQLINLVQLVRAALILAQLDVDAAN